MQCELHMFAMDVQSVAQSMVGYRSGFGDAVISAMDSPRYPFAFLLDFQQKENGHVLGVSIPTSSYLAGLVAGCLVKSPYVVFGNLDVAPAEAEDGQDQELVGLQEFLFLATECKKLDTAIWSGYDDCEGEGLSSNMLVYLPERLKTHSDVLDTLRLNPGITVTKFTDLMQESPDAPNYNVSAWSKRLQELEAGGCVVSQTKGRERLYRCLFPRFQIAKT